MRQLAYYSQSTIFLVPGNIIFSTLYYIFISTFLANLKYSENFFLLNMSEENVAKTRDDFEPYPGFRVRSQRDQWRNEGFKLYRVGMEQVGERSEKAGGVETDRNGMMDDTSPADLHNIVQEHWAKISKNQLKAIQRKGLVADGNQGRCKELFQLLWLTHRNDGAGKANKDGMGQKFWKKH